MRGFSRVVAKVNLIAEAVLGAIIVVMVLDLGASIVFRYILNDSLVWTEECARYLFIWLTFLGAGVGLGGKIHVGVDYFLMLVPARNRWRAVVILEAVSFVIICGLLWSGLRLTLVGLNSEALLIPVSMAFAYAAAPLGALIMLINCAENILRTIAEPHDASAR